MASYGSKSLVFALVAVITVFSLAGLATAADAPAPSPTSAASADFAPIATALLFSAVALFAGALRQ